MPLIFFALFFFSCSFRFSFITKRKIFCC